LRKEKEPLSNNSSEIKSLNKYNKKYCTKNRPLTQSITSLQTNINDDTVCCNMFSMNRNSDPNLNNVNKESFLSSHYKRSDHNPSIRSAKEAQDINLSVLQNNKEFTKLYQNS